MFTFLEGHKIKGLKPGDMLRNIKYFGTWITEMLRIFADRWKSVEFAPAFGHRFPLMSI